MTAVAFIVVGVAGWLLARRGLASLDGPRWAVVGFQVCLGAGIAAGLLGLLYFALLAAGKATRPALATAEGALMAVLGAWNVGQRLRSRQRGDRGLNGTWLLAAALTAAVALSVAGFFEISRRNPEGDWDAWAIWNLRARLLASGEYWAHAWSPLLHRTHPEYPLMLPLFVARGWTYAAAPTTSVPIATALLFQLAAIGLVVSAVALLRGTVAGLLAGIVMVANQSYLLQGPAQYADVPLSLFVLGALASALLRSHVTESRALLVASGLPAGLGCWTKDEGVAFFASLVTALALTERRAGWREAAGRWRWFGTGAAPGLAAWLGFKLMLAPVVTTLAPRSVTEAAARLTDGDRYLVIATAWLQDLANWGSWWAHPILLAVILAAGFGWDRAAFAQREFRAATLAFALLLAAYAAVYLLTPRDLSWQLRTSLPRLCAQVWPAAVLLFMAALRVPAQAARRTTAGERHARGRGRNDLA